MEYLSRCKETTFLKRCKNCGTDSVGGTWINTVAGSSSESCLMSQVLLGATLSK